MLYKNHPPHVPGERKHFLRVFWVHAREIWESGSAVCKTCQGRNGEYDRRVVTMTNDPLPYIFNTVHCSERTLEREAMNLKIISTHRAYNYADSLDYVGYSYILQHDDAEYLLYILWIGARYLLQDY